MNGYPAKQHPVPVKRYCRTMDLKDNPELIAEYVKRHSPSEAWPEIRQGIREVGILEMEIYILDNRLFMIVETPLDFKWETAITPTGGSSGEYCTMGESLMQRRRVSEEVFRYVKLYQQGRK